ncbi:MAG TPA: hypothetical protein VNW50_08495 [Streptosporangiaceae bacterium]|nr:hypothetical protein [Streptosporangiaceae bacterium]
MVSRVEQSLGLGLGSGHDGVDVGRIAERHGNRDEDVDGARPAPASVLPYGTAAQVVSALGVPGLGAARISSGLAAIGAAATRGGMAVGAACVIAAPAAAAAIVGNSSTGQPCGWHLPGRASTTTTTDPAPCPMSRTAAAREVHTNSAPRQADNER